MTFTEQVLKNEAPELRKILDSYLRLSYTEKRGWLFILFTIEGDQPYLSRCQEEIEAWREQRAADNAW